MNIKIKKLNDSARIPKYANDGDGAVDLVATSKVMTQGSTGYWEYGTGLAIEIPEDHVGLLFPRSSISEFGLVLSNSVGVLDSTYRGEIKARFRAFAKPEYNVGDRILQLIIIQRPYLEFQEVSELSSTNRGDGGFGSTGK